MVNRPSDRSSFIYLSLAVPNFLPGDLFYVAPDHDSWVVRDEPYVSLHFLGAKDYAERR